MQKVHGAGESQIRTLAQGWAYMGATTAHLHGTQRAEGTGGIATGMAKLPGNRRQDTPHIARRWGKGTARGATWSLHVRSTWRRCAAQGHLLTPHQGKTEEGGKLNTVHIAVPGNDESRNS